MCLHLNTWSDKYIPVILTLYIALSPSPPIICEILLTYYEPGGVLIKERNQSGLVGGRSLSQCPLCHVLMFQSFIQIHKNKKIKMSFQKLGKSSSESNVLGVCPLHPHI